MARDDPHFRLRIPSELKEQIEAAAKANNRSINAEIVTRLEGSFIERLPIQPPNIQSIDDEAQALAVISKTINELNRYQEHYVSLLRLKRGDFKKRLPPQE